MGLTRCCNTLNNAHHFANRYGKTAESFLGFIDITSTDLWVCHLSTCLVFLSRIRSQCGQSVEAMRHFGEGHEQEKRKYCTQMDCEQSGHECRLTQNIEDQTTEADKTQ